MKQTNSSEFAPVIPRAADETPLYAIGDRVVHLASGTEGTVVFALSNNQGWRITVRWDGRRDRIAYDGIELRKIEALF